MNYSSAKSICQIYKREDRSNKIMFKRKYRKGNATNIEYEGSDFIGFSHGEAGLIKIGSIAQKVKKEDVKDHIDEKDSLLILRDKLLKSKNKKAEVEENIANYQSEEIWNYLDGCLNFDDKFKDEWLLNTESYLAEIILNVDYLLMNPTIANSRVL